MNRQSDGADGLTAAAYFAGLAEWKEELLALRHILLQCGLSETIRWKQPCYTWLGHNVCIIGHLKTTCVLSFFKGALLEDPDGMLVAPGPNTRSAKMIRFRDASEITVHNALIRGFVEAARRLEEEGQTVDFSLDRDHTPVPAELTDAFAADEAFQRAFDALTPGRRRAYLLHFNSPKHSETRAGRIQRHRERICAGKGLTDR